MTKPLEKMFIDLEFQMRTDEFRWHYEPEYNADGTEKHICCDGARFHVLSYSADGVRCSEPKCELNKRHNAAVEAREVNLIRYSTNWMGPINLGWIKQHGDNWATGRIDMRGDSLGAYGGEVGVPPIDQKDWKLLSEWLDGYETDEPDYDVLNTFQRMTGHKITFLIKSA